MSFKIVILLSFFIILNEDLIRWIFFRDLKQRICSKMLKTCHNVYSYCYNYMQNIPGHLVCMHKIQSFIHIKINLFQLSAYFKFNSFVNIIRHIIRIPVVYIHHEILHSFNFLISRKPELQFDKSLLIYSFSFQQDYGGYQKLFNKTTTIGHHS